MIYVTDKKLKGTSFDFYIDLFRSVTVPVLLNFECPSDLDEKINILELVDGKEEMCIRLNIVEVTADFDSLRGRLFVNFCDNEKNTKYFLCLPHADYLSFGCVDSKNLEAIKRVVTGEKFVLLKQNED